MRRNRTTETVPASKQQPKTALPDGRLTTKEAWVRCRGLCWQRGLEAPTLTTLKWHLKHGNVIQAERVRNPFGDRPPKIYAITPEALDAFVESIAKDNALLQAGEKPSASLEKAPEKQQDPEKPQEPGKLLDAAKALSYLHGRVGRGSQLNQHTFTLYLAYDLIPWQWKGKERVVDTFDVDVFLELAPTGIYADHLSYETQFLSNRGDLTMREAYFYYADVDPNPITMSSFRALVAAGIISPIRTANDPKAPILGFRKQAVDAFLAHRQRLLERQGVLRDAGAKPALSSPPSEPGVVDRIMAETVEKALPEIEAARRRAEKERAEWVPVGTAYDYYRELADKPRSLSWFRRKCYEGVLFESRQEEDPSPKNSAKKRYLVRRESVRRHAESDGAPAVASPVTERVTWPIETAYYRCQDGIPAKISLLRFRSLVEEEKIPSKRVDGVVQVRLDDVRTYFGVAPPASEPKGHAKAVSKPKAPRGPKVQLSKSDYSSAQLRRVREKLEKQGFVVEVNP